MSSVGVIIVAAGRGERMGGSVPKQLLEIDGRSILQHSVAAFDHEEVADAIVVVLPERLVREAARVVGPTRRPCRYVAGGERRHDSVCRGLEAVPSACEVILIHDAARPFADRPLIDRVIAATGRTGAAIPAIPARDTVKRVPAAQNLVAATLPRDEIWLAQTPQGFRRPVLEAAIAHGTREADVTDEAMLAEQTGHAVEVVPGDPRNVKITTADDLTAARLAMAGLPRVGTGYDLHRLVEGRRLVLAGVEPAFDRGPLGHSDGDVVCHALADAIFGASGAGDIGQHFPNTDPRWKDVAGLDLLARAVAIVHDRGWRVANADVTVVLERPKLAPHVPAIRERLASVLDVDAHQVSVKGKTNEGVDAVGRGEAIAAHAVVVLAPHGRTPASETPGHPAS